ncbi:hypothetical protein DYI95_001825 [Thermaerobacter sp. PB12/4term]|uniref:hypothetical protein n=1 Tax=Thermaerobacter sp. PB12/4term TaxID=2293838 RepID=UPI000E3295B6|nr:hypothetical protein [Thermaerobacter sp. PB12/4term]QIA26439.1 hypothetical protein DYI95_001825 [Thermaerobacter sp. PB12/4term]
MSDGVRVQQVDQVVPGPCDPVYGCPEPTEIVCIETVKVYDFCFQTDRRENVCFPIPAAFQGILPSDLVTCEIVQVTCQEVSRQEDPNNPGFADVTLLVTVTMQFTIRRNDNVVAQFEDSFGFLKTVLLCAPEGTVIQCESAGSRCGPCVIINGQVCCEVDLCLLIQSKALVKLLVPAYGFCVPAPCVTLPKPPLVCPPENLFPPQCVPPTT